MQAGIIEAVSGPGWPPDLSSTLMTIEHTHTERKNVPDAVDWPEWVSSYTVIVHPTVATLPAGDDDA